MYEMMALEASFFAEALRNLGGMDLRDRKSCPHNWYKPLVRGDCDFRLEGFSDFGRPFLSILLQRLLSQ